MSRRALLVVVTAAAVLASGFVVVTNSEGFWRGGFWRHRGEIPINWRVAGTIAYVELAPLPDPSKTVPGIIIDIVAEGAPGKAKSKVIGIAYEVVPDTDGDCEGASKLLFFQDDMVVTFEDQSMLFATMDTTKESFLCFLDTPTQLAVAHMKIIGGTGKYEGASGEFTGNFEGQQVGASGALGAETGTIKGWLER